MNTQGMPVHLQERAVVGAAWVGDALSTKKNSLDFTGRLLLLSSNVHRRLVYTTCSENKNKE